MNREEALEIINGIERHLANQGMTDEEYSLDEALVTLGVYKQPDTITGLAPCGCGGKARIKHDGSYSSKCIVKNADGTVRYENATVVYPGHTHAWVDCDNNKCECSVGYSGGLIFRTDEEARDAWNVAMGYTAPPLPEPFARGHEKGDNHADK